MAKVAVVGCAHIHTPGFVNALKKRTDASVKYVWDHDPARAQVRAADLGVPVAGDVKQIWKDKEIDAVLICSETNGHKDLVLAGARAKKHMFVEKPLGITAKDAYAMAAAIDKAGVLFQTGYMQRCGPVQRFIREQIGKGSFGKITRARGSNCHGGALGGWFDSKPNDPANDWRWMADPAVAGIGGFGDLGTHSLDILIWLLGEVQSCTAQVDPGTARYPNCDETGEGLLRFQNGVIATLASAWDDVANPLTLLVSGTEGHAAMINGQLFFNSKHVEGADGKQPWTNLPAPLSPPFDLFLDAVNGQRDLPLVTAQEAAYRVAVMEALYEGARKGKWVTPKTAPVKTAAAAT
jgi:predicted dehydrogenase